MYHTMYTSAFSNIAVFLESASSISYKTTLDTISSGNCHVVNFATTQFKENIA